MKISCTSEPRWASRDVRGNALGNADADNFELVSFPLCCSTGRRGSPSPPHKQMMSMKMLQEPSSMIEIECLGDALLPTLQSGAT